MKHIKSHKSTEDSSHEYRIDDFDNLKGWHWKEIDWLTGMGFSYGDHSTRMTYNHKPVGPGEIVNFVIYKNKSGYWLEINNRKHVFKTFPDMMNYINDVGHIEI